MNLIFEDNDIIDSDQSHLGFPEGSWGMNLACLRGIFKFTDYDFVKQSSSRLLQ